MLPPNKEVLIALSQLDSHPGWTVFRKWIRASLKQAFEADDPGVAKGMGYQLVDLLDTIENYREILNAMEKKR
jgi:hypothetical protein